MAELTDFDRDVLRHLNGEDVPNLVWGAALSVAITALYARGLVIRTMRDGVMRWEINDAGRAALAKGDQL